MRGDCGESTQFPGPGHDRLLPYEIPVDGPKKGLEFLPCRGIVCCFPLIQGTCGLLARDRERERQTDRKRERERERERER